MLQLFKVIWAVVPNKRISRKIQPGPETFITRHDCRSLGRKLIDFTKHRHSDNAALPYQLIGLYVCELNQEAQSCTDYCIKPSRDLSNTEYNLPGDTFFLIIMSKFQSKLFEQFSEIIVCLDLTHRTNQYKHKLTALDM